MERIGTERSCGTKRKPVETLVEARGSDQSSVGGAIAVPPMWLPTVISGRGGKQERKPGEVECRVGVKGREAKCSRGNYQ